MSKDFLLAPTYDPGVTGLCQRKHAARTMLQIESLHSLYRDGELPSVVQFKKGGPVIDPGSVQYRGGL